MSIMEYNGTCLRERACLVELNNLTEGRLVVGLSVHARSPLPGVFVPSIFCLFVSVGKARVEGRCDYWACVD